MNTAERINLSLMRDAYAKWASIKDALNASHNISDDALQAEAEAWSEYIALYTASRAFLAMPMLAPEAPEALDNAPEETLAAIEALDNAPEDILVDICKDAITRACDFEASLTAKAAVSDDDRETLAEFIEYVWSTYGDYYRVANKDKSIYHIQDVDHTVAPKVALALYHIGESYDETDKELEEQAERARENCPYDQD
jgi:hypothetical protein